MIHECVGVDLGGGGGGEHIYIYMYIYIHTHTHTPQPCPTLNSPLQGLGENCGPGGLGDLREMLLVQGSGSGFRGQRFGFKASRVSRIP